MTTNRREFLRELSGAGLMGSGAVEALAVGPLVCRVIDEESGRGVPARIRLLDARGMEVVPVGHPETLAKITIEYPEQKRSLPPRSRSDTR